MRIGQNPIKSIENIESPASVTVVVISYIPFLAGYYEESLEILKRCLCSIQAGDEGDFDLLVFDNGSCEEVGQYLHEEQAAGRIQYLMQSSRNLGKAGAWNIALAAAPGEFIIYADSDVLFLPGWLKGHLDVLEAFPQAGMVTGMPLLSPQKYSTATKAWARKNKFVKIEEGQLITWEDFWRHARSLGDEEAGARKFYDANPAIQILAMGQKLFMGAAHFQFAARKKVLMEILPIPAERPMGRVRLLDEAINAKGYLRLSTSEWYVEHMGNRLPDEAKKAEISKRKNKFLWQRPLIRKILQGVYSRIFKFLVRD